MPESRPSARDPHTKTTHDGSSTGEALLRHPVVALVLSLRPDQWTKNLIVFAGLLFGQRLLDASAFGAAVWVFAVFCGLSSAMYLVNDLVDRNEDRQHKIKRHRPIASGAVSTGSAVAAAVVLVGVSLVASFALNWNLGIVAVVFVGLLGVYSGFLKHLVILDVLAIAAGFVVRAVGGAVAVNVPISQWLLVCTVLLALFLGLSKRRHELVLLGFGPGRRASTFAGRVQPLTARPAHLDRRGDHTRELCVLHCRAGDRRKVWHRPANVDLAVLNLRHLSLPLSGPPRTRGREPRRDAAA